MKRIIYWILSLIVALGFLYSDTWIDKIFSKKNPLYVYAPEETKPAFKKAIKDSELKSEYKVILTDDISVANLSFETDKEFDSEYTKVAYSPFVVAYSYNDKNISRMIKSGLLQEAFFNDSYKEINFRKVIEEVLGEGNWENFGVKDVGTIKVYYPAPGTKYYSDYYDFMLVTVNGGIYPSTEIDLVNAIEVIKRFEDSNYTEAVEDFDEKLKRTGGFLANSLYLIPEQEAGIIATNNKKHGILFYPTVTVYVNYYVKGDELGQKLIDAFDASEFWHINFYSEIELKNYRSDFKNMLEEVSDYLSYERDVYNVIALDKERLKPEDFEVS